MRTDLRHLVLLGAALTALVGCSASSGSAGNPVATDDGGTAAPADAGTPLVDAAHPVDASHPIDGSAPPADGGTQPPPHEAGAADAASDGSSIPPEPGWTLVWSDEFDLPDGSPVDPTKWTQETGNAGWGNNHEREYYTAGTANAVIQGGSLVITATPQGASQLQCQYGTCEYTSARMNTSGKFTQMYGRFEARIKLPTGQGLWPAWWLLGDDIDTVSWPQCGEIDIMENIGSTPSTNYGSLHGPGYSGGQDITGSYTLPGGAVLSDDFHLFALEWDASSVRFYVDGVNYETRTPADVPSGDKWVYDHPFFIILNVAVGGYWPGDPDSTTHFPQTMQVDYVRVYTKAP